MDAFVCFFFKENIGEHAMVRDSDTGKAKLQGIMEICHRSMLGAASL